MPAFSSNKLTCPTGRQKSICIRPKDISKHRPSPDITGGQESSYTSRYRPLDGGDELEGPQGKGTVMDYGDDDVRAPCHYRGTYASCVYLRSPDDPFRCLTLLLIPSLGIVQWQKVHTAEAIPSASDCLAWNNN